MDRGGVVKQNWTDREREVVRRLHSLRMTTCGNELPLAEVGSYLDHFAN